MCKKKKVWKRKMIERMKKKEYNFVTFKLFLIFSNYDRFLCDFFF